MYRRSRTEGMWIALAVTRALGSIDVAKRVLLALRSFNGSCYLCFPSKVAMLPTEGGKVLLSIKSHLELLADRYNNKSVGSHNHVCPCRIGRLVMWRDSLCVWW